MKLETFFKKFDQLADALDAVVKMRELVLQLAVQGKLVPQDPNDEPASVLLERVRGARRRLAEKGSLKTKVHIPMVEADDQLYAIPKTWLWVPLNELTELVYGKLLPTSDLLPTGFPVFGANGIIGCFSKYLYEDEMLLISCRGAYSGTPNISPPECYVTNNSIVCEFFEPNACDIRFYHAVISVSPRERIVTGSAQPQVTVANAIKLPVPLPPLAEQKRIVAKVDELMALCDRLEAQQQERETRHTALARASLARFADAPNPANLSFIFHKSYVIPPADLRKSILTLAVQGKLVPQDPNDEPAELLLQRVDAEREQLVKSKKIRRQDFLGPVADDAIPFDIPASWQWRYLADVCFLITDGAHHTPQYLESGVPFLSVKDVSSGTIDFSSTRYISVEAHRELCKRCPPELGDILLTKVGTTGIAVTVDEDRKFSIFVSLALLKFSQPNLDGRYLKHLINSPFVKQQSADNTQGIGNKNLVLRLINRFTVAIPPLGEQRRIVAKVEQLMALVDALEMQIAASRDKGQKLLEAVVGELTLAS